MIPTARRPPTHLHRPASPKRRPVPTFAEAYDALLRKSVVADGARILRGVVPILQLELHIGGPDALRILDRLQHDGHIAQRDGWRVITLIASSVHCTDPITVTPAPASHPHVPHPATPHQEERPVGPHTDMMPTPPTAPAPSPPVVIAPAPPSAETIATAIATLEAQLPRLRVLRDQVNTRVATLEAYLAALRAAHDQYAAADHTMRTLLAESATATDELLRILRDAWGA